MTGSCLGRLLTLLVAGGLCWLSALCFGAGFVLTDPVYLVLSAVFAGCAVALVLNLMREKGVRL